MKLRFLLLPLALLALACGGGQGVDSGDLPGNGNGAGNGDTADSDDGGGNGIGRLCPKYTGLGYDGRSWDWSYTPEAEAEYGQASSWTVTTQSVDGERVVTRTQGELEHPSYEVYTWVATQTYRCDDEGAWVTGYTHDVEFRSAGQDYWIEMDGTYQQPFLVMPWGVGAGDSWNVSYAGSVTQTSNYADPVTTDFDGSFQYALQASDDVTVPAGTFEVLELRVDGTPSSWLDKDAGSVESTNAYLLDYQP